MDSKGEQDRVWRTLVQRQTPHVEAYACREFLEGRDVLRLPRERLPSLEELEAVIARRTGWRLRRTPVRYSDALPWYRHFARRVFLITNYMRSWQELDFTPEPDMFHDIFGHLPFLVLEDYVRLLELFAQAYLRTDHEHREQIKRLAWFTTEFGLVREGGGLKVFGAGLLSSVGEIRHVMAGQTPVLPFSVERAIERTKAIYTYNEQLLAFDSLAALTDELRGYFDSVPSAEGREDAADGEAEPNLADWELADLSRGAAG
jgi:phenylalanine-4-hydroxylase